MRIVGACVKTDLASSIIIVCVCVLGETTVSGRDFMSILMLSGLGLLRVVVNELMGKVDLLVKYMIMQPSSPRYSDRTPTCIWLSS